jgi:hypothetical protein
MISLPEEAYRSVIASCPDHQQHTMRRKEQGDSAAHGHNIPSREVMSESLGWQYSLCRGSKVRGSTGGPGKSQEIPLKDGGITVSV